MGFLSTGEETETAHADTSASKPQKDVLPSADDVLDYLDEHTDRDRGDLKHAAAALQNEFKFLTSVSAYYLLGYRLGLDLAEAFGTKDQDTSLDITNIQPEMPVTIEATVDKTSIDDRDDTDWVRQDVWISDETGLIKLVLWNEDVVTNLSSGSDVKLVDCWADTYNGKTQLKLGKNGDLFRRKDGRWIRLTNKDE